MMKKNAQYSFTAKTLHWLMAAGLAGLVALGSYMADLPFSPAKLQLYSWHKWAGVSLFLLVLVRLAWRIFNPPPALPAHMGWFERLVAHAGHGALYLLMFAIPLTGWLMSSAKGFQTVWFGVLPIPDLLQRDIELGTLLAEVHESLNMLLVLVVIGHALAALKHHFVDKDDVLKRMLPQRDPS